MSIALEAKVNALEQQATEWIGTVLRLQEHLIKTNDSLLKANERIAALEVARKPGPKPKDAANG